MLIEGKGSLDGDSTVVVGPWERSLLEGVRSNQGLSVPAVFAVYIAGNDPSWGGWPSESMLRVVAHEHSSGPRWEEKLFKRALLLHLVS